MKYFKKYLMTLILLNLMILTISPVVGEVNYDVTHEDSEGDVQTMDDNGNFANVPGHEDIDILSITSSKVKIKQNLILEMTVVGIIQVSEEISYGFYILDEGEMIYSINYHNGTCTGYNIGSYSSEPDILVATGAGSDTLIVTVPLNKLGYITHFEFTGTSNYFRFDNDTFEMYIDQVPDENYPWDDGFDDFDERKITINEPINSSTVFKICEIKGITDSYEGEIEFVELQIDSISSSGWKRAATSDNWLTWTYRWDTEDVAEGEHILRARTFDGDFYYFDNITVYVDQETAIAPKTIDIPTLTVGDKFKYKMVTNPDNSGMPEDIKVSGSMSMEITAIEMINVNGTDYNVYAFDVNGKYEVTSGLYSTKTTMSGTTWMNRPNLAIVKEEMTYESTMPSGSPFGGGSEQYSSHDIVTYEPPMNKYEFPIKVSEKWEYITKRTTKSTTTSDGETETDTYISNVTSNCECLRTDTINVPVGSFEVFLIMVVSF